MKKKIDPEELERLKKNLKQDVDLRKSNNCNNYDKKNGDKQRLKR